MNLTLFLSKVKKASEDLLGTSEEEKNLFLTRLSEVLWQKREDIITANKKDFTDAKKKGLSDAFLERLTLDEKGIAQMVLRLKRIQKLQSGIDTILEEKRLGNGLCLRKVRVPLGVIAVIYEARPEVTIDVAALCLKSGNAAILKGGSEAYYTNSILYHCIQQTITKIRFPTFCISLLLGRQRKLIASLLTRHADIDLVIARGGYDLVKTILETSKIPVLAHSAGGARIYVDKSADLSLAQKVILNAKTSKVSACNSLDTLVVHQDIASYFIPKISAAFDLAGVKVISDWETEFLDYIVSIKTVKDASEAIAFIKKYSKKHTEGIIAKDQKVIDMFTREVDAAAIFVNSSTRLHDGNVFGEGAEMGIATGKLHARGPVGLTDLTTYKWIVLGNGHVR